MVGLGTGRAAQDRSGKEALGWAGKDREAQGWTGQGREGQGAKA